MRCGYVTLKSGRQLHYRTTGEGPPLIILHPSPQSSAAMIPIISAFSSVCTCFALDTPGYGLSDPMVQDDPTMGDYAEALIEAADSLRLETFFVYGAATGSQLAVEIAKRYPKRASFVMLDANGHISDEMCDRLVSSGYFADVIPRRDGGHLMTYWDMCRHLFYAFPWNSDDPDDRLGFDIPPASVIHEILLRYLQAGEDYAKAYKAALYTERRAHLDGLDVPTVMTRWASSPVVSIADELIGMGLPHNVRVLKADHGLEARFAVQIDALKEQITAQGLPNAQLPEASTLLTGHKAQGRRAYLNADTGQLHAYSAGAGAGKPIVLLHGAGQSGQHILEQAEALATERLVIVIDLPGHGGSVDLPAGEPLSLDALTAPILSALKNEGLLDIDIAGYGLGRTIALQIAQELNLTPLEIDDFTPYTNNNLAIHEDDLPDLTPRDDGSHLITAWSIARNMAIYSPFWDHRASAYRKQQLDLSPKVLHQKAVDMLRLGTTWRDMVRLECGVAPSDARRS